MKLHLFIIIILSFFIYSCNDDNCFEPSEKIIFEFVNNKNENLIENGSIDKIAINWIVNSNEAIGITDIEIKNNQVILNSNISRFDGTRNFIFITNINVFYFNITSSKVKNCNAYNIQDITFDSVNFTKLNYYYKIIL